jgi:proline racemase
MTAAMFVDASYPGAHAGLVFMDADGYPAMSAHGIIGATTIALERGLLFAAEGADGDVHVALETAAGLIQVHARMQQRGAVQRVDRVAFTNVPAFVHAPSHPVKLATRELRVDIAFGGAFYAIVDTETVGIPLDVARLPDLRRLGRDIAAAINSVTDVVHPLDKTIRGVAGVIFTAAPQDPEAHLRNVTASAGGVVDRSAGGAGTSAVMAVLDAMGLLPANQPFVHEGILGALLRGRPVRRTAVGEQAALVTEIEGDAWIVADHVFVLDEDDPFRDGFRL